jgi:hypothetical protein
MPERACVCGNKISSMTRSLKCRDCRERDTYVKKQSDRRKRIEVTTQEAKQAGKVLLHSCIGNLNDAAPSSCLCRRWVRLDEAKKFINQGRCVDWESRKPIFTGRSIVETGKLKKTPRGASLEKSHIERAFVSEESKRLKGKSVEELKAIVEADQHERAVEEGMRIEVFGQMNVDFLRAVIVEIPADRWDELERIHQDVPVLPSSSVDQRTPGGVGRDRQSSSLQDMAEAA